jgi:hypothetical protein
VLAQRTRQDPSAGNIFNRLFTNAVDKYHRRAAKEPEWKSVQAFTALKSSLQARQTLLLERLDRLK